MSRDLETFFEELSKSYPDEHLLIVLDGAPSHRSEQIAHPENISLLMLPSYSSLDECFDLRAGMIRRHQNLISRLETQGLDAHVQFLTSPGKMRQLGSSSGDGSLFDG